MSMHISFRRIAALLLCGSLPLYASVGYYAQTLPDTYYIPQGASLEISTTVPIAAVSREKAIPVFSSTISEHTYALRLMGMIPIKTVTVQETTAPMLVPCGQPFGIKMHMDGVMIIGFGTLPETNNLCPAQEAGLRTGDMIHAINGVPVTDRESVREQIRSTGSTPLTFSITREGAEKEITVTPQYSTADQCYETGLWIRDSTAGIGTLTFYAPETGSFGGLGHPVCDVDTGLCIPIAEGEVCPVEITDVTRGAAGFPGMLQGEFAEDKQPLGVLRCNNRCGVFGTLTRNPAMEASAIPMAFKQEITTGAAVMLCTTAGETPQAYNISIEEIHYNGTDSTQNMIVRITDERLLQQTGGIVQGMSGSPILQNGKLVGAVTHVFVDDPTKGYGIFCENMIRFGINGS